jgi:hypothetical protein
MYIRHLEIEKVTYPVGEISNQNASFNYTKSTQFIKSVSKRAGELAASFLAQAGVAPDKISIIYGVSTAPHQTIPGESQRMAKALQLKIPCYDIIAGDASLALLLDTLIKTDPKNQPTLALWVGVDAITAYLEEREKALYPSYISLALISKDKDAEGASSGDGSKLLVKNVTLTKAESKIKAKSFFETISLPEQELRLFGASGVVRDLSLAMKEMSGKAIQVRVIPEIGNIAALIEVEVVR